MDNKVCIKKTKDGDKKNNIIRINKKSKCPKCYSVKYYISFPGPDVCCAVCDTCYII